MLNCKIKNELAKFINFKNEYNFLQLELYIRNNKVYYNDIIVQDEENNILNECEYFVNVGYKLKGSISKVLSNLFPYEFVFKGKKVHSIESVFQGIKFSNKNEQNLVLKYSGLDSNNIKIAAPYDWEKNGLLYWQGKPIDRFSVEYEKFVDELYISALQNSLYRNILKNENKYILHSMGEADTKNTVFTRFEFEKEINTLRMFLKRETEC